jgi:hypothetical protein
VTTPQIVELAAEIRRRSRGQSSAMRKQTHQSAADFRRDLPGLGDEVIGEVLLRTAVYASAVFKASPGASARDLANVLGAVGQYMFHHPQGADAERPDDAADDAQAAQT